MKAKILGLLAVGLLSSQANALTFSEPPDLGNGPAVSTLLGDLAIGANTISGSMAQSGCGVSVCAINDSDYFSVNLLDGQEVASIVATITNFTAGGNGRIDLLGTDFIFGNNQINGNGTFSFFNLGTTSAGPLALRGRAIWTNTANSTMNYSLVINVRSTAPVPEPGTLALLGLGLAGLGLSRRRRAA